MTTILSIPSPSSGIWYLGPVPIRGYAIAIILGILAAIWIGERRWVARGGTAGEIGDLAIWAVPFGLVGGRIYHVVTDSQLYFGEGRARHRGALRVARRPGHLGRGGLRCPRRRHRRPPPGDPSCCPCSTRWHPGVLVAQALGRWGNWFNQELFGTPDDAALGPRDRSDLRPLGYFEYATFHPTFLYEFLWNLAAFAVVIWADRRFRLGHGRVLAVYVMAYTLGRGWIEMLRIDDVQLNNVLGLRLNVWTSIVLFLLAAVYLVVSARRRPGRETEVYLTGRGPRDGEVEAAEAP